MSEDLISRKQLDLLPYRIQKALESDAVHQVIQPYRY